MPRMSVPKLVLASTSRYRRALLDRLGLSYTVVDPGVDERAVDLPAPELVLRLSRLKAEAVAALHPNAVVIGADQAPALDDGILTKPGTRAAAIAQLERLAGREHELLTAVTLVHGETRLSHLDRHRLRLRPLGRAEIEDYVDRDVPLDCAGAYKIESLGIALMERIDGEDFTAIVGLPLVALVRMLGRVGIPVLGVRAEPVSDSGASRSGD